MIRTNAMRLALILCLGAPMACAQTDDHATIIQLEDYVGGLVTADVTINGVTQPMIFDTGGGATLMTPEFAAEAGCTPWGRAVGFRMRGDQVEAQICGLMDLAVGGFATSDEVGVFDLGALLPPDLPPVGGILAMSAFEDRAITLDLGARALIVESAESLAARVGEMEGHPLRLQRELTGVGLTAFVPITTEPGPLWFLVDSGHLGPVYLAPHAVAILEANDLLTRAEDDTLAMDLRWGGENSPRTAASEVDIIYDGVVSATILEQVAITFDFENHQYWISQDAEQ